MAFPPLSPERTLAEIYQLVTTPDNFLFLPGPTFKYFKVFCVFGPAGIGITHTLLALVAKHSALGQPTIYLDALAPLTSDQPKSGKLLIAVDNIGHYPEHWSLELEHFLTDIRIPAVAVLGTHHASPNISKFHIRRNLPSQHIYLKPSFPLSELSRFCYGYPGLVSRATEILSANKQLSPKSAANQAVSESINIWLPPEYRPQLELLFQLRQYDVEYIKPLLGLHELDALKLRTIAKQTGVAFWNKTARAFTPHPLQRRIITDHYLHTHRTRFIELHQKIIAILRSMRNDLRYLKDPQTIADYRQNLARDIAYHTRLVHKAKSN